MAITPLPTPPSRSAPSTFSTLADAFIAALPVFVTEANAQAAALELNDTTDASASSVAIGTGAKTFTVTAAKSFQPGMWLVIADDAAPSTNAMYGTVTSYATDQLVMDIKAFLGTGTKTAWTISQSAPMNLLTELTTAINTAYATVASHATTSAIWAAAGNIINFTGTETITDFPAAGQAGSQRFLICAAACVFTHAGNITVQGGATYTAAAGDVAIVTALSTTTFKVNIIRQTETGTGAAVMATNSTLVNPALGTPASGVLTNCTGLPLTTGIVPGAANLKVFTDAAGAAPEWAAGYYVGTITRAMTGASGDVAYSGLGFKPSLIIFSGGVSTKAIATYFGYSFGANKYAMWNYTYVTASAVAFNVSYCIVLAEAAGQQQNAVVKTYDADGFTLTWTLIGTPTTQDAQILYVAFR